VPLLADASPAGGEIGPGTHTVKAVFGNVNSNFTVGTPTNSLTVTQEDARATYVGDLFDLTSSTSTYTATVNLRATLQDITAVPSDPAYDPYAGDIRNATVTFVNRDTNTVLGTVGYGTSTPIVLVNPSDPKTGTVALPCTFTIPSNQNAISPTIGIIVGYNGAGYYTRNSSADNTVVTVALPIGTGFITGGGYLVMQSPAGAYAGDVATNENFGFNVKNNKSGTNLQGNFNSIIRQNGHVYQIKSNSMSSLSVDASVSATHPYPTAVFLSKTNLNDITDPNNPVGIAGNLQLQVTMTDTGTPSNDSIGITLWNGSALWVSSHWNGSNTVEQLLNPGSGNGNLVVHQLQLLRGAPAGGPAGGTILTPDMLQPIISEAVARWQAAGYTPDQLSAVKTINWQVAALPAGNLGWTTAAASIVLDRSAGGYGWFVDPTPADDSEFTGSPSSPARGHVDLLTVVTHEIGHVLGLPDNQGDDLMGQSLAPGVRRYPEASGLLGLQAVSGTGSPAGGTLSAGAPASATPVTASRGPAGGPAHPGAAGGTDEVFPLLAGVSLPEDQGAAPMPGGPGVPGLPGGDALLAQNLLIDWARRSALGFGHGRPDTAAGDPGAADAEEGTDADSVDLFFKGWIEFGQGK
jgi:hypothetical protein